MKHATRPPGSEEGRWSTPDEWVEWFLSNDAAGRREIAEWAMRFAQESERCLIMHRPAEPDPTAAYHAAVQAARAEREGL